MELVTRQQFLEARENLASIVRHTPVIRSVGLSERTGGSVYLKLENLQYTGAFKFRGGYNKISSLSKEERERGIIAASSGNHAQGAALAAKKLGIHATILMPVHAPATKVANTKGFGAEVVQYGEFYDETLAYAQELQQKNGSVLISSYNDPKIIAGQGTIALEMLEAVPDLDIIAAPIGGGGLISGIAAAAKQIKPDIRIIGVQTEGMPSMKKSKEAGRLVTVEGVPSLADGIMVKTPGDITLAHVLRYVDDIVTVSEEEIRQGICYLLKQEKQLAEGAGAAASAAILAGKIPGSGGKNIGAVVSGGNIDINTLADVLTSMQK